MKLTLTTIIFIVLIAGCKKETSSIILLYPINDSIVEPCCINFQWDTSISGDYHLTLSPSENFTTLLIDTLVNSNEFIYTFTCEPVRKYYWRVTKDDIKGTASFQVRDIPAYFEGEYVMHMNQHCIGSIHCADSLFVDTVQLIKEGMGIRVKYDDANINRLLSFYYSNGDNNSSMYKRVYYRHYDTLGYSLLYLNYNKDSILVINYQGEQDNWFSLGMVGKK